jgi:hypothetical protein
MERSGAAGRGTLNAGAHALRSATCHAVARRAKAAERNADCMPCEARLLPCHSSKERRRERCVKGRADGPSACPGGSPFEPGGVSTKAAIPGDMQQAAKSIRVRNAGDFLLSWRAAFERRESKVAPPLLFQSSGWPVPRARAARCADSGIGRPGAAGAVNRPAFRTPPRGRRNRGDRRASKSA